MTIHATQPPFRARAASIPPLEQGDHLTRDEFERRYEAMSHVKKAELIEGVVHMPSPVRVDYHGEPHGTIMAWLGPYRFATPGVRFSDNTTVRLDLENEPQPDGILFVDSAWGGQSKVSPDNYIEGAPELVVEVSASTASVDLNEKFRAYHRNGVREYLVWRVLEDAIDWFELRESRYVNLSVDADKVIRSRVFPGLWLDVESMLRMDFPNVLRVLHQGLESPEHAAFVQELQTRQQSAITQ